MTLTPFLEAPVIIQLHAAAALLAIVLGPFVILRHRRDRLHKAGGYVWVVAMLVVAISSFGITSFGVIGPFSPIHLLSILALWSIYSGMRHIFAGRVEAHRQTFQGLYWRGLLIAGLVNFLPGRATNRSIFSETPEAGYLVLGVGLALIFGWPLRHRLRPAGRANA